MDNYLNMKRFSELFDNDRKQLLQMARIAEEAERYDHMRMFCKELVRAIGNQEMRDEERDVLAIGFNNVISARRSSHRALLHATQDDSKKAAMVREYRGQLEVEIKDLCLDALKLLEGQLLMTNRTKNESRVFFLKMAGDYHRYLAELSRSSQYVQKAQAYYEEGIQTAQEIMAPTHPIRLGLALNYSVCFYEIMNKKQQACELAKGAFDRAISKLDNLDEADYKDSTLIMQLLRDNLTLWTAENQQ